MSTVPGTRHGVGSVVDGSTRAVPGPDQLPPLSRGQPAVEEGEVAAGVGGLAGGVVAAGHVDAEA
ncbi:hypothetical protein AB0M57_31300, partial [Streptomyces sp. NPDC051597]|uniref:hypothetical protein n=1 Tax=Streptomyces sp. NPDC051597 TaxID=3155049 RepID=UPI00341DA1C5